MDGISALCVALLIYFAAPELFPATPAATGVTLGLLFAFIDYLQRVFVPIREFSAKLATIQRAVGLARAHLLPARRAGRGPQRHRCRRSAGRLRRRRGGP